MSHQADPEGEATLLVAIEFTDSAHRSMGISWSPGTAAAAHKKLECARIFVAPLGTQARRMYLDIVDGHPWAEVHLPATLPAGEYAIEVDGYGSSSWGDGRLEAHGRSAPFTIGAAEIGGQ